MMEIKAIFPAPQLSKVVLAVQAIGEFPSLILSEVRRIDPRAPKGLGGIADSLMDPRTYIKLELLCSDEQSLSIMDRLGFAMGSGEGGMESLYATPAVFPLNKPKPE